MVKSVRGVVTTIKKRPKKAFHQFTPTETLYCKVKP